jgi:hypothetical protein
MRVTYALGQRASFWIAAAVVVYALWTSAAPAMSYPLYAAEWHLTPAVTTSITSRGRLPNAGLRGRRRHEAFLSRRDFMSVDWQFTAWNDAKEKTVS